MATTQDRATLYKQFQPVFENLLKRLQVPDEEISRLKQETQVIFLQSEEQRMAQWENLIKKLKRDPSLQKAFQGKEIDNIFLDLEEKFIQPGAVGENKQTEQNPDVVQKKETKKDEPYFYPHSVPLQEETVEVSEPSSQPSQSGLVVTLPPETGGSEGSQQMTMPSDGSEQSIPQQQPSGPVSSSYPQQPQHRGGGQNPISRINNLRNIKKRAQNLKNAAQAANAARNAATLGEGLAALTAGGTPWGWIAAGIVIVVAIVAFEVFYLILSILVASGGTNGTGSIGDSTPVVATAKQIVSHLCRTYYLSDMIPGRNLCNGSGTNFDALVPNPVPVDGYSISMRSSGFDFYHPNGRYWCTDLVIDAYNITAKNLSFLPENSGIGYVPTMMKYFQTNSNLVYLPNSPGVIKNIQPGFAIFFDYDTSIIGSHVAIVKSISVSPQGDGTLGIYEANGASIDPTDNLPGTSNIPISNWQVAPGYSAVGFGGPAANANNASFQIKGALGTGYCSTTYLSTYFSPQDVSVASCICNAESGGSVDSFNPNCSGTGDYSIGLFQINFKAHPDLCQSEASLVCTTTDFNALPACMKSYGTNPVLNINAAVQLHNAAGNWNAWTTKSKCL